MATFQMFRKGLTGSRLYGLGKGTRACVLHVLMHTCQENQVGELEIYKAYKSVIGIPPKK